MKKTTHLLNEQGSHSRMTAHDQQRPRGLSVAYRLWCWLTEPHDAIRDVAVRRKSRLLATLLLLMFGLFLLLDISYYIRIPGYVTSPGDLMGYLLLGSAYLLNRRKQYALSAALVIAMFPLVLFSGIITNQTHNPTATLSFLVLGILLGSILLSMRAVGILAAVNISGIVLMPTLASETIPDMAMIINPLALNLIGTALALVAMYHRTQIERDRQAELAQTNRALQTSEERYRIVSELTSDYAYACQVTPDGTVIPQWLTGAFTRITGYRVDELSAQDGWERLVYPDDMHIPISQLKILMTGEPSTIECRFVRKDGKIGWVRIYAHPVWDTHQQRTTHIYGAVQDITERKRTEEELQTYYDHLEELVKERTANLEDAKEILQQHRIVIVQVLNPGQEIDE